MVQRGARVRTRTLGTGWSERFLEALRKARDGKLIPAEQAEKLRSFAGAYFCAKCDQEHRTESELGKKHLRTQPKPATTQQDAVQAAPAKKGKPKLEQATLAVELTGAAKAAGKSARAKLEKRTKR